MKLSSTKNFVTFSNNFKADPSDAFGEALKKDTDIKLHKIMFSNIDTSLGFSPLEHNFQKNMRTKLFGTMRGSLNSSELVSILPYWLNSENMCVESSPVQWENELMKAFVDNCESLQIDLFLI